MKLAQFQKEIANPLPPNALEKAAWRIASFLELQTKLAIRNNPKTKRAFGRSKAGLVDTGALLNSVKGNYILAGKNKAIVTVGSYNVPYAAIHEFGGVIKPKGEFLTIPFSPKAKGLRVRNYPGGLFRPKGKNVLLDSETKELAYILARKVTIPARPYLRLAIERSEKKITEILESLNNE